MIDRLTEKNTATWIDRSIDIFKIFKKLGVAWWWKLIRHRSNEKSKNNNNSSNSNVFGLRPQTKIEFVHIY